MPQQMDDELLQQAQAGEESAIAALITAMMPAIRKGAAAVAAPGLDFDDAVQEAVRMMRDFVAEKSCLDPTDALMLLSLVGDTQISQIVDPQKTARCHLPLAVLDAYGISLP